MKEKFKMKKGQVLIIMEYGGLYFISWENPSSNYLKKWPNGDDKILLEYSSDFYTALRFVHALSQMFGVHLKIITHKYCSRCILAVEII